MDLPAPNSTEGLRNLAETLRAGQLPPEAAWNQAYPSWLSPLAPYHFTPLSVIQRAAHWLTESESSRRTPAIVDLGSGAGKFCLVAAVLYPRIRWVGLERRPVLLGEAEHWRQGLGVTNCHFEQADIANAPLAGYAGAYAFNPFFEHVDAGDRLANDIEFGVQAYRRACAALRQNLAAAPRGFRLVSYFCHGREIPTHFERVWEAEEGKLVGWQG